MKTLFSTLLLFVFALTVGINAVSASTAISKEETREVIIKKVIEDKGSFFTKIKESKRVQKLVKKFKAFQEKMDLKDPVDKWMWYWILGWGLGFVLYSTTWFISAPLWYLGYLCWTAGTVCGVIWILKKYGGM